jgi:hypothetical protein
METDEADVLKLFYTMTVIIEILAFFKEKTGKTESLLKSFRIFANE